MSSKFKQRDDKLFYRNEEDKQPDFEAFIPFKGIGQDNAKIKKLEVHFLLR